MGTTPSYVIIDDSVFSIIRIQICPKALDETDKVSLRKFVNDQNQNYNPFKFFINDKEDLMFENCMLFAGDEVRSEEIYLMLNVMIVYLNDNYRKIMKLIWGGANDNA